MTSLNVAVLGLGVVGASIAWNLARQGAQVKMIEARHIGAGATGASFAWVNARSKLPRDYYDLNLAGVEEHRRLAADSPGQDWLSVGGRIEWKPPEDWAEQIETVERLQTWGYPVEWIDQGRLAQIEPDISVASVGDAPLAWFPRDAWLAAVPYAAEMIARARALGAQVVAGQPARTLLRRGENVTGVGLADGTEIAADVVVSCLGASTNDLIPEGVPALPFRSTNAFMVFSAPAGVRLRAILSTPYGDFRPDGAGRLMLHSNQADTEAELDPSKAGAERIVETLRQGLATVLPATQRLRIEAQRRTLRPIPGDGRTIAGHMPGVPGYYVVATHSGVTLSPFLGRVVAEEIVSGHRDALLAAFGPERFAG